MFALFDDIESRIGFMGPFGSHYSALSQALMLNDMELGFPTSLKKVREACSDASPLYDFLFVDIDGLGGINKVFDGLSQLRLDFPSLPVILLSSEFETDDFDISRYSLGDVSLRSPVLYSSLELGLFQARSNNKIWQANVENYRKYTAA